VAADPVEVTGVPAGVLSEAELTVTIRLAASPGDMGEAVVETARAATRISPPAFDPVDVDTM
jgi:hypothetical protein